MIRSSYLLFLVFLAAGLLGACSDDGPQGPAEPVGLVVGQVDPSGTGFTLILESAGTPGRPLAGPFVLLGENVRWLPGLGALAVDLKVSNAGESTYDEPVGLTFTEFRPDSVLVLDADNGMEGPGASILFEFENDDAQWTPGETSLPRTVTFSSFDAAAIAFTARLDIGQGPMSGAISGLVWFDLDDDHVADPDEPGLPGIRMLLEQSPSGDVADPPLSIRETSTDVDGRFVFDELPAGFYTVRLNLPLGMVPDTPDWPSPLHVLLVEVDGHVSSFEAADFGIPAPVHLRHAIPAAADATVRADVGARTNDNYGCAPYVAVGTGREGTADMIRGLLRFDLPDVATVGLPSRVLLIMEVDRYRDGSDQTYQLGVHAVLESGERTPWIEGNGSDVADGSSCLWVDEAEGVAWYGAGDGGDANNQTQPDFAEDPVAVVTFDQADVPATGSVGWDVTPLVLEWLNGTRPNLGLVVRDMGAPAGQHTDFRSLWFVSREAEEPGASTKGPLLGFIYDE